MIAKSTPTQVRNDFEEIKDGYAGIQVYNDVNVALGHNIKKSTIDSILRHLTRSKAIFIGSLLLEIFDMNFNLDLAIVASSQESEDTIMDIVSCYDFLDFVPMKRIYQSGDLFGIMVAFRKDKISKKSPFQLKADVIVFLDSCLIPIKEKCTSLFKGAVHRKPQVLSVVCLRTPDVPVSNYKDQHPTCFTDLNTPITDLPPEEADLFQELVYPEMDDTNRRYYNLIVKENVANWMKLKDKSVYKPDPSPFKMLPLKSSHQTEESIVEGLITLEKAWDKAYDELYRTIYGDD